MILTHNLTKSFDSFLAVNQVNLHVDAGEVLALLGPNGAGKTTTVRMLTSILRPTSGHATVAGFDIIKDAPKVRSSVGVLTEMHGLYDRMPADDYLDFFGQLYKLEKTTRHKRISELLDRFGLTQDAKRRIGEYSKGMRQKLALARSLIHRPPVLLLDEPTSAMDPESARLVRDALHELRSADRAIVICTHNLMEAEELADKIAIIYHGRIIASGSPEELKCSMLGPPEYELRLGTQLNGHTPHLPGDMELTGSGSDWLRYRASSPGELNPTILRSLLSQGIDVISLHEVNRSLEQVYLQAVNNHLDQSSSQGGNQEH
jgi:ABC-2 type transport system ATP-binding protein